MANRILHPKNGSKLDNIDRGLSNYKPFMIDLDRL
jgi:hypothetical protein